MEHPSEVWKQTRDWRRVIGKTAADFVRTLRRTGFTFAEEDGQ